MLGVLDDLAALLTHSISPTRRVAALVAHRWSAKSP